MKPYANAYGFFIMAICHLLERNEKSLYVIFKCSTIWVLTKIKKRGISHEKGS